MNFLRFERKVVIKKVLFAALGASAGYAYYHFIGCASGSCPITGNPYISTAYGALFGFVLSIDSKKRKKADDTGN